MADIRFWLLLLWITACSSDTSSPNDQLLLGDWGVSGGSPARLIGLPVGAELQLPCRSVQINRPVSLGQDGRFAFRGQVQPSTYRGLLAAQVNGRVEGEIDPRFENLPICPL